MKGGDGCSGGVGYRGLVVLLLAAAIIIIPVTAATAESIISVGTQETVQETPVVSAGRIAWVDYRGGTTEIYLYDILTGEEHRVSPEGATCGSPDISGDRVVWRVDNGSWSDVDILDLTSGEHTLLSREGVYRSNPDIDGTRVVWDDDRAGNTDIYLYDLATGEETQITSGEEYENNPAISGDRIVWQVCDWEDCDLFFYDLSGEKKAKHLGLKPDYLSSPVISGPIITWSQGNDLSHVAYVNLDTGEEGIIPGDGSAVNPPAISGERIVWEDGRNGNIDLYLYDVTCREEIQITDDPDDQVSPSIDGDRLVWTDFRNGVPDIYLGTMDTALAPPEAAFSANATIGESPLTVQFTDESAGDPVTWRWDFGDGETSPEPHPLHTYGSAGVYSVTLTVSSTVGRSQAVTPAFIHCGSGPSPSFTADRISGVTPLTVRFTDTSSGDPSTWHWDFGDGETSEETDPVHTYVAGGTYSVTLTAGNSFGEESWTLDTPIEVLNGMRAPASTDIGGLSVEEAGGGQFASVDPCCSTTVVFDPSVDPTVLTLVPDPATGWARVTLQAQDTGFSDTGNGILTGTLTGVILESTPLRPSTFSLQTGQDLEIIYALNLSAYPVLATVDVTVWENVTLPDYPRFLKAAYNANYDSISAVAYTADFSTVNLTGVRSAKLNLSAQSSWVDRYGVSGNITLLRLADDGTTQGIKYRDLVRDPVTGTDFFLFESPKGLSRFALASTSGSGNPFQLLVLSASSRAPAPSTETGSSSNDYPEGFPTSAPRPAPQAEPARFRETGRPELTDSGLTIGPFLLTSSDEQASLTIAPATRLTREQGLPIQELSVLTAGPVSISPPEGSYYTYTGIAYDLEPDGVAFDPPAEVQFRVDPARWQDATRYQVLSRRGEGQPWEVLPTRQDDAAHTVTATVSHFSLLALFSWPVPVTSPPQAVPTLQAAPKQVPRTPLTTITGVIIWAASTAQTHVLEFVVAILLIGGVGITLRRGVPVKTFRPWVFLYLISLSAYLWATFSALTGGPLWLSAWIFIVTAGLNLIVHVFRFDRITLIPARRPVSAGSRLW